MTALESRKKGKAPPALDEASMLYQDVLLVMIILCQEYEGKGFPKEFTVHLLASAFAKMFPKLALKHGFVYHVGVHKGRSSFPHDLHKVAIYFPTRSREIKPKEARLKVVPHSWLVHEATDTVIDVLPPGAQPGVDYPMRRVPHPDRPPYNEQPDFELLKLPAAEEVDKLWKLLEKLTKKSGLDKALY